MSTKNSKDAGSVFKVAETLGLTGPFKIAGYDKMGAAIVEGKRMGQPRTVAVLLRTKSEPPVPAAL